MNINGKEYELVEVYEDEKDSMKDLLLFRSQYGYKECFQRFDILNSTKNRISKYNGTKNAWTYEEDEKIKNLLKKGMTTYRISRNKMIDGRTEGAIFERALKLKKQMKKNNEFRI